MRSRNPSPSILSRRIIPPELTQPFMEKLVLDMLHNLQRMTQANFLTFRLRAEESFNPIIPSLDVCWEGNQPDSQVDSAVERKLIEQAVSTGQIACLEASDDERAAPGLQTAMVLPIMLDHAFAGSLTLGWESRVTPTFDMPM